MIVLCRVDHRLLHGQVAFSWTNALGADCILIADDDVVSDDIWKTTLKLAKPANVKLVIKNVEDAINALNSGVTDKYQLLIVVRTIDVAYQLAQACPQIQSINLGGTKKEGDDEQISKAIFVSETDKKLLKELMDAGKEVEIRMLSSDSKQVVKL
ncbi:PTS sugar transporter subunit IIB [Erysipelothrix amsterdamensis]|uniref:PTS sugar transporter subunit IIB n=1 Tax=Erysipelothrix amsterdamensis TaxID=2929157 RepID=A0AAU9VJ78_9FIRM|nr:PTS sugar transporter subunit IIB [Erysipelothrix rhusiopathiae]CAH2763566.1 PTS sugar transporter subunit IIB [Erysipelothrix sp. A18Y020d]AYV34125.1 PTS mannose/fructose/sorbose transporter subunit IIB [Erysipelothrix rhusiopathiae]MDE8328954.1 PTS sugar transporter subunit IIB [Erysipelothrix rhusiopathiae]MDE8332056.1 PTS sugar transporter subunit IIB [Erysipelothrix rhusiopathiae]CAH2763625.1 PTS sugar transporter subunit IIB [Erysipelothrix sp. A18Y020d]